MLSENTCPVISDIYDCLSGHILATGKKDPLYIADLFNGVVVKFDPNKNRVNGFILIGPLMYKRSGRCWRSVVPHNYGLLRQRVRTGLCFICVFLYITVVDRPRSFN